ncbi:MAG: cytoplasmic protein [Deltaproteobacteria bacterium]|nr:MAG: cytoplasmic protein [Deltaproteobacteria bacterium]
MKKTHSHNFVENYEEPSFGLSRKLDEEALQYYLQKLSDDEFMEILLPKLEDKELEYLHNIIFTLLKNHISDDEYHKYFLKDDTHG